MNLATKMHDDELIFRQRRIIAALQAYVSAQERLIDCLARHGWEDTQEATKAVQEARERVREVQNAG